jgi:hypothetical protein
LVAHFVENGAISDPPVVLATNQGILGAAFFFAALSKCFARSRARRFFHEVFKLFGVVILIGHPPDYIAALEYGGIPSPAAATSVRSS